MNTDIQDTTKHKELTEKIIKRFFVLQESHYISLGFSLMSLRL